MKYIRQFFIIIAISAVGELISSFVPLPVPAGIYGIIILFIGLTSGIIPYEKVKDVGHFLVDIMQVMFIPATVGLIDSWGLIKQSWLKYLIILIISTVAVFGISGRVTQHFIRKEADND